MTLPQICDSAQDVQDGMSELGLSETDSSINIIHLKSAHLDPHGFHPKLTSWDKRAKPSQTFQTDKESEAQYETPNNNTRPFIFTETYMHLLSSCWLRFVVGRGALVCIGVLKYRSLSSLQFMNVL